MCVHYPLKCPLYVIVSIYTISFVLLKVFEGRGVSPEPMVLQRTDNLISTDNELGLSPNTDDQVNKPFMLYIHVPRS